MKSFETKWCKTKTFIALFISFITLLFLLEGCTKDSSPVAPVQDTSFLKDVVFANYAEPIPVKWSGKTILGYELHGYNFENSGYEIFKIDVIANTPNGTIIKTYEGNEFAEIYQPYSGKVANGSIIFLWPEFTDVSTVPDTLYHKIYFKNDAGEETFVEGIKVGVIKKQPVKIGSPVKGKNWWWSFGPSNLDPHHRRAVMSFQSRPFCSQRFAVDLLRFGDNQYLIDPTVTLPNVTNSDFYCYSDTLYAVADGTVFNSRDGLPDIPPLNIPPMNLDNADGNYIILEIPYNNGSRTDTVYANYAHLKTGSLLVSTGQVVHKGDPIGLLGNSGNTTGPHLHFHIMSKGYGVLLSQGLPFTIDGFHLKGIITNGAQLEGANVPYALTGSAKNVYDEMPAMDYLVDFN
jgi:hypothetical protein